MRSAGSTLRAATGVRYHAVTEKEFLGAGGALYREAAADMVLCRGSFLSSQIDPFFDSAYWFAEIDGALIGWASVNLERCLVGVFVRPEWRGHGVGSALARMAADYCAEQGLRLSSYPHDAAGAAVYRKAGVSIPGYREPYSTTFSP